MKILIYIILVIALLVPLTLFLAILLKSISFLVKSFRIFKNSFNSKDNSEMESV